MADPEANHEFVYSDAEVSDIDLSPFFDAHPGIDFTVGDYIQRIQFTLSEAVEEHLGVYHRLSEDYADTPLHPSYAALQTLYRVDQTSEPALAVDPAEHPSLLSVNCKGLELKAIYCRKLAECSVIGNRMNLEQSVYSEQPEVQSHLQLKEIEREIQATLDEISKREAEYQDLLMEFEMQPKLPSRKLYIKRITEITKNSWKLDADIQQILKETRELQLESNSIQERLHRTYAVVDEIVFREAKKDAVGRQAYRLLTSIHDIFQQITDTILATDRVRRETAGQEAKIAALSSRSFDITKLQADLDSIRKENELLEQQCRHS